MYTLLSTVVAPSFTNGTLTVTPVELTTELLAQVERNLCGHPITTELLKSLFPYLPEAEKAFWDGSTLGLSVRPRGGVRGGGDVEISWDSLECAVVTWCDQPATSPTQVWVVEARFGVPYDEYTEILGVFPTWNAARGAFPDVQWEGEYTEPWTAGAGVRDSAEYIERYRIIPMPFGASRTTF